MSDEHETPEVTETPQQPTVAENPYLLPGAIIIAGLLIAGAVLLRNGGAPQQIAATGQELTGQILPVTAEDHVLGSRDADVFFIEYSDYRCGYCGRFHGTIQAMLEKYQGKLAWVYRHTPYQPGGREAALASECIATLAGENAFWEYTDLAMNNQQSLSPTWSKQKAIELGVEEAAYDECYDSGDYDEQIRGFVQNAQEMGAPGTPFTVLLTKNGDTIKFGGAQPADMVEQYIERALESL